MPVKLNAYVNFPGQTKEAMKFYRDAIGGELTLSTFKEGGMPVAPGEEGLIMHAALESGTLNIMAADATKQMPFGGHHGFGLSLSGDDEATLRGYWDKLTVGGNITMALEKAPWGDTFGMFNDKFGVAWMIDILPPATA